MVIITVRIPSDLNTQLEQIADRIGVPKTALIILGINYVIYRKVNFSDINTDSLGSESVRFSLRLPEHLKLLLDQQVQERVSSINSYIVDCCRYLLDSDLKVFASDHRSLVKSDT